MISIILPTYNERENIKALIEELQKNVEGPLEIVVVDDDSPDGTWKVAGDIRSGEVNVIRRKGERGLATAIGRGLVEARGDLVGWMDADMCMPPSLIPEMSRWLGDHDIAIGSRYAKGGADKRGAFRVLTSRIINLYARILLGFDLRDYDSGFILMHRKVLEKVPFPSRGYGDYFIEFMYRCKKKGLRIKEVPYVFTDRTKGVSKTAGDIFGFFRLGMGYISRITGLRLNLAKEKEA